MTAFHQWSKQNIAAQVLPDTLCSKSSSTIVGTLGGPGNEKLIGVIKHQESLMVMRPGFFKYTRTLPYVGLVV
jgi:hypothetical protein